MQELMRKIEACNWLAVQCYRDGDESGERKWQTKARHYETLLAK